MECRGREPFGFMVRVDLYRRLDMAGVCWRFARAGSALDLKWALKYGLEAT